MVAVCAWSVRVVRTLIFRFETGLLGLKGSRRQIT